MERKILTLNGINRNNEVTHPDAVSCIEMINVRFKDNAWREIKSKSLSTTTARAYDEYFIHTSDTVKNWIGWSKTQEKIFWFDGTGETEIGAVDVDELKFQSVGNILVIYTKTGDNVKILYSLFDKTTNSYGTLIDFEFDVLDIQFYKQVQKYPWIFAHRVTVDGAERVNWIAMKFVQTGIGGGGTPEGNIRIVYYKDESEVEIKEGYQLAINETVRFYPKGIFFASTGTDVIMIEAYDSDGLTNINHNRYCHIKYDDTVDRYYREYLSVKYYDQYDDEGIFGSKPGAHLPIWDLAEPLFILNDTDADGATEPLDVSAGTTVQEKYTIVEGAYNRDRALAQSHGFFEGFIFITYAFKLFDGNYIKYSFPKLLYVGEENIDLSDFGKIISDSVDLSDFKFNTLGMYIKDSEATAITNLQTYYNKLIESIDIFISKPVSRFDFTNHDIFVQQGSQIKELTNQASFYKVFSVPLKDLTKYVSSAQPLNGGTILHGRTLKEERTGTYLWDHYNVYINTFTDLNTLETFEALPVDNYSAHIRYASSIFKYNNRLMISNTIQKLWKGHGPARWLQLGMPGYINKFYFEVVLETSEGIKYVRSDSFEDNNHNFTMPEFFGYPDNRATKFRILNKKYDEEDTKLILEIELTKHLTHNFAYYIAPALYQQYILELESNNIFEVKRTVTFDLDVPLSIPAYPDGPLDIVEDNNKISITEVNNPFIFPAKYTYQVGNSEIIGLQSNSIPVSTGQFGQYPVVVATKTGFWSLNISESGEIYIANITPLNGLVCTNKESLINIEGTIIFVAGEDIVFLAGNEKTIISDPLRGAFGSKVKTETVFQQIADSDNLFAGFIYLSSVSFTTYLSGAKFAYDRISSEFIVTNSAYPYSYVFSSKYRLWYKVIESWNKIVQDYPDFFGINTTFIFNLSSEGVSSAPIFIETQAIEFSSFGMIKLNRLKLKFQSNIPGSRFLGTYIMGSMDGEKWAVINGMEPTGIVTNPILNKSHLSVRYIKLIISSEVNNIELKNIDVDFDVNITGKIR